MGNMFSKAKAKPKATTKKAADKVNIVPAFESDENQTAEEKMKEFHNKLAKFAHIKKEMSKLKAELTISDSFIKDIGKEEFIKLLEKTGKRETSYILSTEFDGTVLVTVQDKYKTIDDERAEYLNETYGEFDEDGNIIDSIVNEDTKFQFNMTVLERNQEAIADLIENCEEITDEDKENLIECVTKYSIKKGTIDKLYKISQDKEIDIETLYEEIQPIMSLKSEKAEEV
jgi:hypothetical protein